MQGKALPERSAETPVYVGIDVCKDWLDVHLHPVGQDLRVANTSEALKTLKRWIAGMPVALIVMEATAKFHRQAHRALHAARFAVAVVNPLRARLFAEAAGQLAKTDRIDARSLALMGCALAPTALAPAPEAIEAMRELAYARSAATADQTALSNQRGASQVAFLKAELDRRLKALATHIRRSNAATISCSPFQASVPSPRSLWSSACRNRAPVRQRRRACWPALRRWLATAAKKPANATSEADAPSCERAFTSSPSPPRDATRKCATITSD